MLADHIQATTAGDVTVWVGVVVLWLVGVVLVVYRKLRATR